MSNRESLKIVYIKWGCIKIFPLRHSELISGSYLPDNLRMEILKQVQKDVFLLLIQPFQFLN